MPYNPPCFRSERFILINQSWYFQVRESQPVGPFDCLESLRIAMKSYLDVVTPPRRYALSHNSSIDCSGELHDQYPLRPRPFPKYSD